MARQFAGLRKGAPQVEAPVAVPPADDADDASPELVECPNCHCQFDPNAQQPDSDAKNADLVKALFAGQGEGDQ